MRDLKADSRFIKELSQGHMLEAQKYALSLYLEACERALAAEATIEKQNQGGLELARRIDELEAEVEEYKKDINMWGDIVAELHIENAKLRKVVEAARNLIQCGLWADEETTILVEDVGKDLAELSGNSGELEGE